MTIQQLPTCDTGDSQAVATTCGKTWGQLDELLLLDNEQLDGCTLDRRLGIVTSVGGPDSPLSYQLLNVPTHEELLQHLARTVHADQRLLSMPYWHQAVVPADDHWRRSCYAPSTLPETISTPEEAALHCGTVHCLAGHAVAALGPLGFQLELRYGPAATGWLLLGPEAASHFYDSEEDALEFLERFLP